MNKKLKKSELYYIKNVEKFLGQNPSMSGDYTGLSGEFSGLRGDLVSEIRRVMCMYEAGELDSNVNIYLLSEGLRHPPKLVVSDPRDHPRHATKSRLLASCCHIALVLEASGYKDVNDDEKLRLIESYINEYIL